VFLKEPAAAVCLAGAMDGVSFAVAIMRVLFVLGLSVRGLPLLVGTATSVGLRGVGYCDSLTVQAAIIPNDKAHISAMNIVLFFFMFMGFTSFSFWETKRPH